MLDRSVICLSDNDDHFCWDLTFARFSAICMVFGVVTMFAVLGVVFVCWALMFASLTAIFASWMIMLDACGVGDIVRFAGIAEVFIY